LASEGKEVSKTTVHNWRLAKKLGRVSRKKGIYFFSNAQLRIARTLVRPRRLDRPQISSKEKARREAAAERLRAMPASRLLTMKQLLARLEGISLFVPESAVREQIRRGEMVDVARRENGKRFLFHPDAVFRLRDQIKTRTDDA